MVTIDCYNCGKDQVEKCKCNQSSTCSNCCLFCWSAEDFIAYEEEMFEDPKALDDIRKNPKKAKFEFASKMGMYGIVKEKKMISNAAAKTMLADLREYYKRFSELRQDICKKLKIRTVEFSQSLVDENFRNLEHYVAREKAFEKLAAIEKQKDKEQDKEQDKNHEQ